MKNWRDIVLPPNATIGEAIATIDASGVQTALIATVDFVMLGIVTDGNIRRAVLAGTSLSNPVGGIMTTNPMSVRASASREEMLAIMKRNAFHHLPIVADGKLVGLITLDELVEFPTHPNWVVLMAGGLGTRLHPLTRDCPKPMLTIGGKPILESILETFAEQGFNNIFVSVNYKADMIREYFGNGERWGVRIEYLQEEERLGTAGSLSLLPRAAPGSLLVMNGDLLTKTNFQSLIQFHAAQAAMATMAVREYHIQVPYGVVRVHDSKISSIEEKPTQKFFVNAGIYVLEPACLSWIPKRTYFDMPTLFKHISERGETTTAYPLREYWIDIGQMEEFEKAKREWTPRPV